MVEQIGTASTMQAKTLQSVKSAEAAKTREVSEKEPTSVQANESRKYDRFEYSSEVSYAAGSPDDPKAREAFDEKKSAVQTSNPRSYDRVEFSGKHLSDLSAKATDSVNVRDMSDTQTGEAPGDKTSLSNEEVSSSQSASDNNSSESVDTNKLYQYTDTELKDFLIDGSITQSEYDAEIAKREA